MGQVTELSPTAVTQGYKTKRRERVSYALYSLGQINVYIFMYMFLQIFLTDLGIPVAVVGTIFLVARIWDAVNDPMFGIIVDKSRFKAGKYLPWLRVSSFLIPAFTIALFAIPADMSITAKITAAAVLYVVWGMSYTVCDVPYFSVTTAMMDNLDERNRIIANGRMLTAAGPLLVGTIVPLVYPKIGWFATGAIIALFSLVTMVPLGFIAKERNRSKSDEFPAMKELILSVVKNKYLLVFCAAFIVSGLTNASVAVSGYFATYVLGGPQMMSVIFLASIVPTMAAIGLVPTLSKWIDKFYLYMGSLGLTVLLSVPMYFVGYQNLTVFIIFMAVRNAVGSISAGTIMSMFILDCSEYSRFKTGTDATASSLSLQTFTNKLFVAVSGGVGMFILGIVGFVSGDQAVQPQAVLDMLWIMMSILPVVGQIVSFFMLLFGYRLRDKDVQIMARANRGLITREEASAQLSRKY